MNMLLNSDDWFLITVMERGTNRVLSTNVCSGHTIPEQLMEYSEMMLHPEFGGFTVEIDELNMIINIERVVNPREIVDSRWKN